MLDWEKDKKVRAFLSQVRKSQKQFFLSSLPPKIQRNVLHNFCSIVKRIKEINSHYNFCFVLKTPQFAFEIL